MIRHVSCLFQVTGVMGALNIFLVTLMILLPHVVHSGIDFSFRKKDSQQNDPLIPCAVEYGFEEDEARAILHTTRRFREDISRFRIQNFVRCIKDFFFQEKDDWQNYYKEFYSIKRKEKTSNCQQIEEPTDPMYAYLFWICLHEVNVRNIQPENSYALKDQKAIQEAFNDTLGEDRGYQLVQYPPETCVGEQAKISATIFMKKLNLVSGGKVQHDKLIEMRRRPATECKNTDFDPAVMGDAEYNYRVWQCHKREQFREIFQIFKTDDPPSECTDGEKTKSFWRRLVEKIKNMFRKIQEEKDHVVGLNHFLEALLSGEYKGSTDAARIVHCIMQKVDLWNFERFNWSAYRYLREIEEDSTPASIKNFKIRSVKRKCRLITDCTISSDKEACKDPVKVAECFLTAEKYLDDVIQKSKEIAKEEKIDEALILAFLDFRMNLVSKEEQVALISFMKTFEIWYSLHDSSNAYVLNWNKYQKLNENVTGNPQIRQPDGTYKSILELIQLSCQTAANVPAIHACVKKEITTKLSQFEKEQLVEKELFLAKSCSTQHGQWIDFNSTDLYEKIRSFPEKILECFMQHSGYVKYDHHVDWKHVELMTRIKEGDEIRARRNMEKFIKKCKSKQSGPTQWKCILRKWQSKEEKEQNNPEGNSNEEEPVEPNPPLTQTVLKRSSQKKEVRDCVVQSHLREEVAVALYKFEFKPDDEEECFFECLLKHYLENVQQQKNNPVMTPEVIEAIDNEKLKECAEAEFLQGPGRKQFPGTSYKFLKCVRDVAEEVNAGMGGDEERKGKIPMLSQRRTISRGSAGTTFVGDPQHLSIESLVNALTRADNLVDTPASVSPANASSASVSID